MKNLRKLREERGLSQQRLAEIFGISQQSIYKYENGIAEPDLEMLMHFADYFYTSVDYLIGYIDEENSQIIEPLTNNEIRLIKLYRHLSKPLKHHFSSLIREIVTEEEYDISKSDTTKRG